MSAAKKERDLTEDEISTLSKIEDGNRRSKGIIMEGASEGLSADIIAKYGDSLIVKTEKGTYRLLPAAWVATP